ncbi:MAG: flagellar filament capping protein FliD [Planctomycetota bacterium]
MSGISSGIGLISGINTSQLIDQLMAIESRPVTALQKRSKTLDAQRTTFLALSAQVLAVQNAIANFGKLSFFRKFNAASSNENILNAVAGEDAVVGSTTFRVHSLVSNHVVASRGFADADRTPVGVGTISIEIGNGQVNRPTELSELNGGRGVRRGVITITDRSGASADIDLSQAFTLDDVLNTINTNTKINVRASVTGVASNGASGDRLVIEDLSGGTDNLIVADKSGGSAAADLGIAANVAGDRIDGADIFSISTSTLLKSLNDGNGVDRLRQGVQGDDIHFSTSVGDFGALLSDALATSTDLRALNGGNGIRLGVIRVTDRSGKSADIDLTNAKTVQDVLTALNGAGLGIDAITVNSYIQISDKSGATGSAAKNLKVEDVSGFAAADLGIAADTDKTSIRGKDVYRVATVGDLVRAINYAPGNASLVEASISADGNGITLRALGFDNTVTVTEGGDSAGNLSQTVKDLGLLNATFTTNEPFTTRPLVGGLNTVLLSSLQGGRGATAGVVSLTDASGRSSEIDLSSARTLKDVIDLINSDQTVSLTASINSAGNGITLRNDSDDAGTVEIHDISGSLAADLGIAGTFDPAAGGSVNGGNLQVQYVSRQTNLADLNGGRGVKLGAFRITASNGAIYQISPASNLKTVGQVIDAINAAMPDTIEARINDTGDGVVVIDNSGGTGRLTIENRDGGTAASDLRLAGTAAPGTNTIDGSFETRIVVGASDTLKNIVDKLNAAKAGFSASVVNDGGGANPYSLTIASTVSGRRGELVIDSGGIDLGIATLTRPQDAVISVGQGGSGVGKLIISSTNTLKGVIPGVTVNLVSAAAEDVTVTTKQDVDSIVEAIKTFVDAYNDVQQAIGDATSYNVDTKQRGPLLGDSTVSLVRSRLQRAVTRSFEGVDDRVSRLFAIGLRIGANNHLEFDEDRFRQTYEQTPEAVEQLFTLAKTGFGATLKDSLEDLTRSADGLIARKDNLIGDQQKVINDRIDSLNVLLAAKRKRLETRFAGLEAALSGLLGQQNALTELAALAGR